MNLRKKGYPVGLLKIKTFRPFPTEKVREVLADKKKVVVADRNISFGKGGIFADEIKGALFNLPDRPVVFGCVIGLGGRDITPQALEEIVMDAMDKKVVESEIIWKGLKP